MKLLVNLIKNAINFHSGTHKTIQKCKNYNKRSKNYTKNRTGMKKPQKLFNLWTIRPLALNTNFREKSQ